MLPDPGPFLRALMDYFQQTMGFVPSIYNLTPLQGRNLLLPTAPWAPLIRLDTAAGPSGAPMSADFARGLAQLPSAFYGYMVQDLARHAPYWANRLMNPNILPIVFPMNVVEKIWSSTPQG
jgi:hypothetical protein